MNGDELLAELSEIARDVFDDDDISLTRDTTAKNVNGWDSMGNVRLMIAVERAFKIRFDIGEFQEYRNVGDLADGVAKLLG